MRGALAVNVLSFYWTSSKTDFTLVPHPNSKQLSRLSVAYIPQLMQLLIPSQDCLCGTRVRMLHSSLSTTFSTHTFAHKPNVSPRQASFSLRFKVLPVPAAACAQHLPLVLAQSNHKAGRKEQCTCDPRTHDTIADFDVC